MTPPAIVLASTSPYRRALLERLGLKLHCISPGIDEDAFKAAEPDPLELARKLAIAKAENVARERPESIVIGGDQLVAFEGEVLGKPGSLEGAEQQLARLSGKTHMLITATTVCFQGETETIVDQTRLTMRTLSPQQIQRYVTADKPVDCSGSYKIESRGIALFAAIESEDHTAITGLPLVKLVGMLVERGVQIP